MEKFIHSIHQQNDDERNDLEIFFAEAAEESKKRGKCKSLPIPNIDKIMICEMIYNYLFPKLHKNIRKDENFHLFQHQQTDNL